MIVIISTIRRKEYAGSNFEKFIQQRACAAALLAKGQHHKQPGHIDIDVAAVDHSKLGR